MYFVNIAFLLSRLETLRNEFNSSVPFRHIIIDDFLDKNKAEDLLSNYPLPTDEVWHKTTYIHQKGKLQKASFDKGSAYDTLFAELNSKELTDFLEQLTGIKSIVPDNTLFGAGLHQSLNGAFLDVHVDFNIHPTTRFYRRLNLLIFLNKNWQPEYGGELELWDMEKKVCVEKILPSFNRCVIFETNEKSFHGHPVPLNVPEGVTRKSLAVYYYTKEAPADLKGISEHNSIFVDTQGIKGKIKNLQSALIALKERILNKIM
jgi:Rps23 Pro-64 3,4-dihydroxylase Tpa1-like proline 4-hydroxylase